MPGWAICLLRLASWPCSWAAGSAVCRGAAALPSCRPRHVIGGAAGGSRGLHVLGLILIGGCPCLRAGWGGWGLCFAGRRRASGRPRPSWLPVVKGYTFGWPCSSFIRQLPGVLSVPHGGQRPGGRAVADLGGKGIGMAPAFWWGAGFDSPVHVFVSPFAVAACWTGGHGGRHCSPGNGCPWRLGACWRWAILP